MLYGREIRSNCQIFRFTGLLDMRSAPAVLAVLEGSAAASPKNFILDFSQVESIDGHGVEALVKFAKQIQKSGGTLQTVDRSRVAQVFKLLRLEKLFSLQPSVQEALAALDRR